MTLHYHGTPITPAEAMLNMAGKCFCVSFAYPSPAATAHRIGQSVMHDNGAFTIWKRSRTPMDDWSPYYRWVEPLIANPVHWAVIPDAIDAGPETQDKLLLEWPFGFRGAPVWHMDEPIGRLLRLCDEWPKVCIGSTAAYAVVGSAEWRARIDEVFLWLSVRRVLPWVHMLRGMQTVKWGYPFASVDSTDVARNHHLKKSAVGSKLMAELWDSVQCPNTWGFPY